MINPQDRGRYKKPDVIADFSSAWAQWTNYEEETTGPKAGDWRDWL